MKKGAIITKGKGAAEVYPPLDPQASCELKIKRTPLEQAKIEKTKKISVKEANAYSLMDGFGFKYITPFALAIGANNMQIGLLNSMPSLIGNLSQFFTLKAMYKWSRKKITFWGVLLQAVMWLVLIGIGALYFIFHIKDQTPAYFLIIAYTLLILFGAFSGPAWSSWMKDIITQDRGEYFGSRARISGVVALVCMLIAGFILDYFSHTKIFIGFFILFFIAFLGRTISALLMLKQYEPKFRCEDGYYFTFFQFVKKMLFNNFGRFVFYFSLVCLTTAIAGPFFAVYMLKNLGFSYIQYMVVILSNAVAALVFMPAWGKFADKYGNLQVIKITGWMTPIIPFLWIGSSFMDHASILVSLIIIEAFSGFVWAGFNLAAGNFLYDAVTRQRLAICSSYLNILAGLGVVIGSVLGGIIASMSFTFLGLNVLLFIFLLSGIARLIVYFLMNPRIQEVRNVKRFRIKDAEKKLKHLSLRKFFEYLDIDPHIMRHNPT